MTTTLLRPTPLGRFPFHLSLPFALGFGLTLPLYQRRTLLCESSPSPPASPSSGYSHSRDAHVPITASSGGINPQAIKQMSLGSILGLSSGLLVSVFSRTLTLLFGVGIVVVQYAASKGYNILPIQKMQRYVKRIDLRSLINDNAAFKLSFGITFAMAAFAEF